MKALQIFAGPRALARIRERGLTASDVRVIPAAAGGPKGLILLPLDRFLFGEWLTQSTQPIDLVGASIGSWRMAAAALAQPVDALYALEDAYIHQEYDVPLGRTKPTPAHVSERFGYGIRTMFAHRAHEVLQHPRFRLHIVTARGRHWLHRDNRLRLFLGYTGAFLTNVVSRKAMSAWLERAVFSSHITALPFAASDYRTRRYVLSENNFSAVVQASGSIPFVFNAVHEITGAAPGAYWDGGITDYHLHLDYRTAFTNVSASDEVRDGVVLYPHFQRSIVPGWLDKLLKWRHRATHFLDDVVVLAPNPQWIATLPNGKLPDRTDFMRYGRDLSARVAAWQLAVAESQRLRDEFSEWLYTGDVSQLAIL